MTKNDTWEKPRSRAQGLTETEIDFVRECFIKRRRIEYCAETLRCASRTVTKYYGYFRAEGVRQQP